MRLWSQAMFGWLLLLSAGCGRGGLVVVGAGETLDHLASFDDETSERLRAEVGFAEPAVGLKYEYFSLFFLNVWTWEGDVVIYEEGEDSYIEVTPAELREYTGRSSDDFARPFFYRFPLGQLALLGGLLAFVVTMVRRMREH